jgi:hypothetical protein
MRETTVNTAQSAQLKRKIEAEARGQEVEKLYLDWLLDEALRETFPASDAIAIAVERAPENVSARKHKKAERP